VKAPDIIPGSQCATRPLGISLFEVQGAARSELVQERFRTAVDAEKARLRRGAPWWHRFIPMTFTLIIKRRTPCP
jgi:hypothetical protein